MRKSENSFRSLLEDVMRRRRYKAGRLAGDIGVSHATVSRWLSGDDVPNAASCFKLAGYLDMPVERLLSTVGHIEKLPESESTDWPEFREYARAKYPDELDEDIITMIEDLIERRREKKYAVKKRGPKK